MSKNNVTTTRQKERAVLTLFALTEFDPGITLDEVMRTVRHAPDPETACRAIIACIRSDSEAIRGKWRQLIQQSWQEYNPKAIKELCLPITSAEVEHTPALDDIKAYLKELAAKPCAIAKEHGDTAMAAKEVARFTAIIPSLQAEGAYANTEHEYNCLPLLRLRLLSQTLRLTRIYNGQLQIVQSRYRRFLALPATHQFYVIWHADAYHLEWGKVAGIWQEYIEVVQNYLPLMWEAMEDEEYSAKLEFADAHGWAHAIIELYFPLWEQEGLLENHSNQIMKLYRQITLPQVVQRLVVQDLLLRYGIARYQPTPLQMLGNTRTYEDPSQEIQVTHLGNVIIEAEKNIDLPCGIDLLN